MSDFNATLAEVYIEGTRVPSLVCTMIEDNADDAYSRAYLRYGPLYLDPETSILTPTDSSTPSAFTQIAWEGDQVITYGMRVVITGPSQNPVYFCGMLANRSDTSNPDSAQWECVCDKWLLGANGGITVRGAMVANGTGSTYADGCTEFQYCPAYIPIFNPDGFGNCIGCRVSILTNGLYEYNDEIVPVFAPYASKPKQNTDYPGTLQEGVVMMWTPRLAMQYLRMILTLNTSSTLNGNAIIGLDSSSWRTIYPNYDYGSVANPSRLIFTKTSIDDIHAWDPQSTSDDLADKAIPTMAMQGKKALAVMTDILSSISTTGMRLNYTGGSISEMKSSIYFFTKAISKVSGYPQPSGINIMIQKDGEVNSSTFTSFALNDRREDCSESCLVEGEVVKVESEFKYDQSNPTWPNSTIIPAWTTEEEQAFILIINGALQNKPYTYIPYNGYDSNEYLPFSTPSKWMYCDGKSDRPLAFPYHETAISLARKIFPNVFCAFRVIPTTTQLSGYASAFSGNGYAKLRGARIITKEQEQTIMRSIATSITSYDDNILNKYPTRISVFNYRPAETIGEQDQKWVDVHINPGIRMEATQGQGGSIIYFDGLGEKVEGELECLYTGRLRAPDTVQVKPFKINTVIKLDHRVSGTYDLNSADYKFYTSLRSAMGGPPQSYVDSRQTLVEDHQVNSTPSAFTKYPDVSDGIAEVTAPLNRILPPIDGRVEAGRIAKRKALWMGQTKRDAKYVKPGIDVLYKSGTWIDNIERFSPDTSDYVPVSAAIKSCVWDFIQQETIIKGLIQD